MFFNPNRIIFFVVSLLLTEFGNAQFPEIKSSPIYDNNYLELSNISLIFKDYKIPSVKIFTSEDLKGKPVLELSKDGVKVQNKTICTWASREDLSSKGISIRQPNSNDVCKEAIFPFATSDESKFGEIRFWIIANGKETDSYYSANKNGKTYYIDKKSVSNFVYKKSVKQQTSERYTNNYLAIKKYLALNPELSTYIGKVKKCTDKKDFQCLNLNSDEAKEFTKIWAQYFCTNHSERANKKFKTYCRDVKTYLCNSQGGQLEYLTCDTSKADPKSKLEFSDLGQKSAAENFFWDELKSCLVIEPNATRVEPPGQDLTSVVAKNDENYRLSCLFVKKSETPISWKLEWLIFRQDEYGLDFDQIQFDAQ